MWRQQRGDRLVIRRHCALTHNHPTHPGDTSESRLLLKTWIGVAHVLSNIFGQRVKGETVEMMECLEACHCGRPLSAHGLIVLSKVGKLRCFKQKVVDGFWYLGLFCTVTPMFVLLARAHVLEVITSDAQLPSERNPQLWTVAQRQFLHF